MSDANLYNCAKNRNGRLHLCSKMVSGTEEEAHFILEFSDQTGGSYEAYKVDVTWGKYVQVSCRAEGEFELVDDNCIVLYTDGDPDNRAAITYALTRDPFTHTRYSCVKPRRQYTTDTQYKLVLRGSPYFIGYNGNYEFYF